MSCAVGLNNNATGLNLALSRDCERVVNFMQRASALSGLQPAEGNPVLQAEGLYKIFSRDPAASIDMLKRGLSREEIRAQGGGVTRLEDVSFSVMPGEIFIIMGLSGSGKSTLIRCLNRLIEPTAGHIRIDGQDVTAFNEAQLRDMRRRRMSMVFQSFGLLPHRTVLQNVKMGMTIRGDDAAACEEVARDALAKVGLKAWADHYPLTLSGGMRQRVGLARALATKTDILLMDEPFSALDPLIRRELQDELLSLQAELKKTIIFVTHDIQEAVRIGSRIAIMREGRTVQIGTPQELITNPADDYVRDFARDLDRGLVLRCGDVMRPLTPKEIGQNSSRSVPASALLAGAYKQLGMAEQVVVAGEHGEPVGMLSAQAVLTALGTTITDRRSSRDEGKANG